MGRTRCSVVALGCVKRDYRGAERPGTLLERMGALREGMDWKDFSHVSVGSVRHWAAAACKPT